jgi:catalase
MPKPADAAVPTRQDLDPSPALSIVQNGPERFEGRKLGFLVSDGSDTALLKALKAALDKAGATYEIIAPKVMGVEASDGSWIEADQMIDGGPSVLYDAVVLLPAAEAMDDLLQESAARDFVATLLPTASSSATSSRPCRSSRNPASPPKILTSAASPSQARRTSDRSLRAWRS